MVDDDRRGTAATLELPASDRVPAAGALEPGQVIGRFVIRERLGEGGMGVVLAGHDTDLDRRVAIKLLKPEVDQPAYRARLLREAQAMARLEHPNVLRVYEVGTDRGRLFVAMELVDGVTLTAWLRGERRPWRQVVAMFQQVGAGLAAVHRDGLVHRDFKPDNVLVDGTGHARVADFGLARLGIDPNAATASPEFAASLTRTGVAMGTPGYMAPEQQFGGDVDARADQYSYCVALREALLGKRGAPADDASWAELPRGVRRVIARGLAYEAAERFASMDELLAVLASATRRRTGRLAAVAVTIAVAGGVAAVIATSGDRVPATGDRAPAATVAAGGSNGSAATAAPTAGGSSGAAATAAPTAGASTVGSNDDAPAAPAVPAAPAGSAALPARADRTAGAGSGSAAPARPRVAAPRAGSATVARADDARPGSAAASRPDDQRGSAAGSATGLGAKPPGPATAPETPKRERHELVPAHRAAVLAAIADLGYGGLTFDGSDREADLRDARAKLAAETDPLKRGAWLYAIGAIERKRGNCAAAEAPWRDARKELATPARRPLDHSDDIKIRDQAFLYLGRIWFAQGLCELAAGHALAAAEPLRLANVNMWAASELERTGIRFAQGIVGYETGDEGARITISNAWYASTGALKQAIERYSDAVSKQP